MRFILHVLAAVGVGLVALVAPLTALQMIYTATDEDEEGDR